MASCLILAPFPLARPKHGGQVRAASMADAMRRAGWQVDAVGIYHERFFPREDRSANDIVLDDPALADLALGDMLFADLHVARAAAANRSAVDRLRRLLVRLDPDVMHMEHPWDWMILRAALPSESRRPKIVYSSQNIEWKARSAFFGLGMKRRGGDALVEAVRALELEVERGADLVLSISDLEAATMRSESGRPVIHVPAVSSLAGQTPAPGNRFAQEASTQGVRYAAMMGSAYWPNVEGFFGLFPDGLGFLSPDERIWVAGALGSGLRDDPRYEDFRSMNDSRLRTVGYVDDAEKAAFFAPAACVLVPVLMGAGAKLKTADAIASGCPVIATSHALEGYGPIVHDALGCGVYVADTPREYRALVRRALREGLAGCKAEVRARVGLDRMAQTLGAALSASLNGAPAEAASA